RALALQRHGGQRRRPRPGAGAGGAAAAVGGAPRAPARRDRRQARARVRRAVEASRPAAARATEAPGLGRREADAAAARLPPQRGVVGTLERVVRRRLEAGLTRSPARAGRHCRLEGLERVEAVPAERGRALRLADEERPL